MSADLSLWTRVLKSTPGRYVIALFVTVLALFVRRFLDPFLGDFGSYTTLYPGIAFLAIYVGLGPSIVSVILGLIGASYWFVPARGALTIWDSTPHIIDALTFLTACACIIALGEASRRSRISLQHSEALFDAFLDNSPSTEYLKDQAGTYVYINKTAGSRFRAEFIGKTDAELFPGPYPEQWRSNDLKVLKENKALEFIETTSGPEGERTWLSLKFPVTDTEGRTLLGGKSFDITERKKAEEEIARLQRENAQRVTAELEAVMRLQEVGNRCVRSGSDFYGTLEAIVEAAIFLTGADKGNLQLLDPSSGKLILTAQRGFEEPFLSFFSAVKEQPSVCGAVIMRGGKRIVVEDVTRSEIFTGTPSLKVLVDAGVRAVQSTPLVSSTGKLLGMMSTHFSQPHQPSERDLRLVDLLARQAGDYLERKEAEETLRISEERLRLAQMTGKVGVWDWDVKGNRVRLTPEQEALYGLQPGTVRTYDDFRKQVHPDDLAMLESKRNAALKNHEPFDLEFRVVLAGGEVRWVIAKGRGFYDDAGRLVRVVGTNIDITERKRAEEELKELSAQLQRFLNTVPSGLARCSRDRRYVVVNPAYAEIVGLPVEQIIGQSVEDVFGATGWEIIQPYVERALRGERVEYQSEVPFANSGTRYIHVIYTPDTDTRGEVVGWVASITDITESKKIEAQLQKVEKLAAAGQLAASLAHEINNPLSSVTNALYLLNSGSDLDETSSRLVAMAESELARVARIVRQSLSYHRAGKAPKQLDLGSVVEESLQIFKEKFHRSNIELTKKIAPETLIIGFADEIRQVIDNLLLNALEATPSGGRVVVSVHCSRNWKSQREGVRLTIGDTGHGIPRQKLTNIFEPFFTTKDEKGTGLGLWVVSGIVAKHDGSIKIRSTAMPAKSGTVISILWPSTGQTQDDAELAKAESAA